MSKYIDNLFFMSQSTINPLGNTQSNSVNPESLSKAEKLLENLYKQGVTTLSADVLKASEVVVSLVQTVLEQTQEIKVLEEKLNKNTHESPYSKLIEIPKSKEERLGSTPRMDYKTWKALPENKNRNALDCLYEVWGDAINEQKVIQSDLDKGLVIALRNHFNFKNNGETLSDHIPTLSEFNDRFSGSAYDYQAAHTLYRKKIKQ